MPTTMTTVGMDCDSLCPSSRPRKPSGNIARRKSVVADQRDREMRRWSPACAGGTSYEADRRLRRGIALEAAEPIRVGCRYGEHAVTPAQTGGRMACLGSAAGRSGECGLKPARRGRPENLRVKLVSFAGAKPRRTTRGAENPARGAKRLLAAVVGVTLLLIATDRLLDDLR
jgi:hypothetical protein